MDLNGRPWVVVFDHREGDIHWGIPGVTSCLLSLLIIGSPIINHHFPYHWPSLQLWLWKPLLLPSLLSIINHHYNNGYPSVHQSIMAYSDHHGLPSTNHHQIWYHQFFAQVDKNPFVSSSALVCGMTLCRGRTPRDPAGSQQCVVEFGVFFFSRFDTFL